MQKEPSMVNGYSKRCFNDGLGGIAMGYQPERKRQKERQKISLIY